jgi:hypothetical protein
VGGRGFAGGGGVRGIDRSAGDSRAAVGVLLKSR